MKFSFFKKKEPTYESEIDAINKSYEMKDKSKDTEISKEIELLKVELKYHKIDATEYEKRVYDAKELPWAKFKMTYNEETDPNNMQTELVYNEYFIKKLQRLGYSGESNDDIVQSWLSQVFAANVTPGDLGFVDEESKDEYVKNKKVNNTFIVG